MSDTDKIWQLTIDKMTMDAIEVQHYDSGFNVEVDEPWAGDTEHGFGETCHIRLTEEQAESLAKWILNRIAKTPNDGE